MTDRYKALISDELFEALDTSLLPEGIRIVEIAEVYPFWMSHRLVTFEYDDAPEELDGRMVIPLFQVQPDRSVIMVGQQLTDVPILGWENTDDNERQP